MADFETIPLATVDYDPSYIQIAPEVHSAPLAPSFVLGPFPEWLTRAYFGDIAALSVGCYDLSAVGVTSHGLLSRHGQLFVCNQLNLSEGSISEASRYGNICVKGRFSQFLDEPVVSLVGPGYLIYGHWLVDFLPKLYLLHRAGINPLTIKYFIPTNTPNFGLYWLRLLGISESQLIFFDPYSEIVGASHLIAPTMLRTGSRAHPLFQPAVDYLLSLASCNHPFKTQAGARRKLFVSRGEAGRDGRKMLNRQAIERVAVSAGFEIVRPEALTLVDQIATFASAGRIVGEYGSGLHGSIFSPPETIVCALRASAMHPGFLQSGLCQIMAQKIGYVFGATGENDIEQEFTIAEADFQLSLRLMDFLP